MVFLLTPNQDFCIVGFYEVNLKYPTHRVTNMSVGRVIVICHRKLLSDEEPLPTLLLL